METKDAKRPWSRPCVISRTHQGKDGSWGGGTKVAYTGLVLLAYLGHCETPLSEEFGVTVQSAITFLVDNCQKNKGRLASNPQDKHWCYSHAIGAYAIAEAYTFCRQLNIPLPGLEDSVQMSIQWIIDNQNKSGGWEYSYDEAGGRGGDMSITAWQLQALKAGKHTGLDFRNMSRCIRDALNILRRLPGRRWRIRLFRHHRPWRRAFHPRRRRHALLPAT